MRAQLKPRINLDNRPALEALIPLATPLVVFVDPASACNFKCLSGDTPVNTIYGAIPIAELAKTYTEVPVFTYDYKTRLAKVATARNIRHTGRSMLVRVLFDDDSYIECTPDHKFQAFKWGNQRSKGSEWFSEARNLKPGTCVRAIKFPAVRANPYPLANWNRKSKTIHIMVAEWKLGRPLVEGERVHHDNHNKMDWAPDNLIVCSSQKEHVNNTHHPEISERMRTDNPTKNGLSQEWRDNLSRSLTGLKRTDISKERYRLAAIKREKDKRERVNHRVVSVKELDGLHDTYCLEVPETGWFYANNVLVKNCVFCPTGHPDLIKATGRYQGAMKFDLFTKIVNDLADFDKPIKVLRLYKDGEPFLNKRLADMVSYAKRRGNIEYVDTTTNGSLMTPERLGPVLDAGIDRINVSVEGMDRETYLRVAGVEFDVEDLASKVRWLYAHRGSCEVAVKIIGDVLTPEQRQQFLDTFGDHCDRIFVENFAPCWPEFDVENFTGVEISTGLYGQSPKKVEVCPYIFYGFAVNADGLVSSCFQDWERKLVVGDARTQSMRDIWNSDKLNALRLLHLEGRRRENPVCGNCGQLTHCMADDLGSHREALLEKFRASLRVAA